ncbi:MAG: hypothetical protein IKO73_06045 [Bacteroidaceae bacterium]|nr:hypothetical protein [Bacteroidaceae bacterium]
MKRISLLFLTLFALGQLPLAAQLKIKPVSGVYVGGHIRRERPKTITKLRESGFTYALLFNVHVCADGTLITDGDTICYNGEYVFDQTHPNYQEDIKNLKTAPTSIQRIEIVIGGWGNDSYDHIRDLINKNGTGSTTMLYKNFRALRKAVPEIDAVNNDDEHCYEVETGAKFHIMMYNLGYKTTLAPYTNKSYWQNLCTKIRASKPKAVDCVMVQCYDGGAANVNQVGSWTFTGVTERHAGLMYYSNDWNVDKNIEQFQKWKDDNVASGGFVWVYNSEEWDLNAWASGMNRVYGAVEVPEEEAMIEVYSGTNYTGYSVKLPVGTFSKGEMAVYGIKANDIESVKILKEGASVRLYKNTNNAGTNLPLKADRKSLSSSYKNLINSITVSYEDPVGINEVKSEGVNAEGVASEKRERSGKSEKSDDAVYDLSGRKINSQPKKGIYIENGKKIVKR